MKLLKYGLDAILLSINRKYRKKPTAFSLRVSSVATLTKLHENTAASQHVLVNIVSCLLISRKKNKTFHGSKEILLKYIGIHN